MVRGADGSVTPFSRLLSSRDKLQKKRVFAVFVQVGPGHAQKSIIFAACRRARGPIWRSGVFYFSEHKNTYKTHASGGRGVNTRNLGSVCFIFGAE